MIVLWEPGRAAWKNVLGVVAGIVTAPVVLPVAMIAGFLGRKGARSSPKALSDLIDEALDGPSRDEAWDQLTSVALVDPMLEGFRVRAAAINDPPWSEVERTQFRAIQQELHQLVTEQPA